MEFDLDKKSLPSYAERFHASSQAEQVASALSAGLYNGTPDNPLGDGITTEELSERAAFAQFTFEESATGNSETGESGWMEHAL